MNIAPRSPEHPKADGDIGLEGLSTEEKASLLDIAEILRMEGSILLLRESIEYFLEHAPDLDDDDAWAAFNRSAAIGKQLAKVAKLPSDPVMYQQPHDMERLVRTVVSVCPDICDELDEIRMGRLLYWLVGCRLHGLLETLPMQEALREIRIVGINCLHHFGPRARSEVRRRLLEFCAVLEWFTDTEGLHDPHSGDVDVDAAALRKYRKGGRA